MRRIALGFFVFLAAAFAANVKLYLKDGTFQLAREYQVQGDRVHYYSVERSEWEDIPTELIDLKRTEGEIAEHKKQIEAEAKVLAEEDKAERDQQNEILRIPQNPGVYVMEGKVARKFKAAESTVHTNKGRSVLKVLSPIPMVTGKATLEINDAHSANALTSDRPELYIQLEREERFGIVKLTPQKNVRIVEKITAIPVTKEMVEEPEEVEIFRKQLTPDGLYKIWPQNPLEPGEYAVVEYEPGKLNMQVWDFAYKPAAAVKPQK
jgi:hypothetical protein